MFNPPNLQTTPSGNRIASAFSVLELLVVMGIISLLLVLITPAAQSLVGARGMTNSINTVADTLREARTYAMANNTYVWVGFREEDSLQPGTPGIGSIVVGSVASRDGTALAGASGGSLDPGDLIQIGKIQRMKNVSIQPSSSASRNAPIVNSASSLATAGPAQQTFALPLASGGSTSTMFDKVIRFNPRGEADFGASSTANEPWIEIGLEKTQANQRQADAADFATVNLAVLTGAVTTYH